MKRLKWISPLLFLAATALAQSTPVTADTLWAGGTGKFECPPDTALVQFSISVQQAELKTAYAKASESAQNIRQMLKENGIDPKDAEIGSFSMAPTYTWKPTHKLTGFQVNSRATVKVHNFSKLPSILDSFSQIDTSDSLSLSYTLENIESAKAKAVEDAYHAARRNAEALAHAGGRTLGAMSYASVDTNELMPQPRPMAMSAQRTANASPSPLQDFEPALITVTARVSVLFQLN